LTSQRIALSGQWLVEPRLQIRKRGRGSHDRRQHRHRPSVDQSCALSFIKGQGFSDRLAQLIWDLVALNSTLSLALHKEPEVAVGTMGIGLDYGGFGVEAVPAADVEGILSAFPRVKMKQRFAETCCRLVTAKPETSHDNFLRDFGERFVPGYKALSTVDLLMNAPFDE
jgi:hypothetical protein